MRVIVLAGAATLLAIVGCQNVGPKQGAEAPQDKDVIAKLRLMAAETDKLPNPTSAVAELVNPKQKAAVPAPTAYSATWPDGSGGSYSLTVPWSTVVHTPAPVTPPPVKPPTPPFNTIPSNAQTSGDLGPASNWQWNHDPGTPGTSTGTSVYPSTAVAPAVAGDKLRSYSFSYTGKGGQIYHVSWGKNATPTHFVYDTYVYFPDTSQLQNVEMDMNQVVSSGATVIYGMQCASGSKTWEYTTMPTGHSHWNASNVACNPLAWTPKVWHHIQIATERNAAGTTTTADWVCVDGNCSQFTNATGPNGEQLGWAAADLLLNFQLDGNASSGSITAYTEKMQVWYW